MTADLPCNQAIRAVADRLVCCAGVEQSVVAGLSEALLGWAGISSWSPSTEELTRLAEKPVREDYRTLLELCLLLWQGLAPGPQTGSTPAPSFLLNLERVFERYLTRGLIEAWQGLGGGASWRVEPQRTCTINLPVPGQPDLTIRPDVLLLRDGSPLLVVDAKWKRLARGQPETADLYQMLAYCTALDIQQAALIYPGRRNRAWTFPLRQTPVRIGVHTLTVTASPERCRGALRRLADALIRGI